MIRFLNKKLKDEFDSKSLDRRLKAIVLMAAAYVRHRFKKPLWVTSILRPGDKGVHGYGRGLDGDNDALTILEKKEVQKYVNGLFVYDPERPRYKVCRHHKVKGRGGDHWHFQVHPNTTMKGV